MSSHKFTSAGYPHVHLLPSSPVILCLLLPYFLGFSTFFAFFFRPLSGNLRPRKRGFGEDSSVRLWGLCATGGRFGATIWLFGDGFVRIKKTKMVDEGGEDEDVRDEVGAD